MAKGFIRGVMSGVAVSAVTVSALSVLIGLPREGADQTQSAADSAQTASPPVPAPASPEPDTTAAVERSDITPSEQPQADVRSGAEAMTAGDVAEGVDAPTGDAPVSARTDVSTPQRPATEAGLSISTEPAQPPMPAVETARSAFDATPEPVAPASEAAEPEETAASEPASEPASQPASGAAIAEQITAATEAATAAEIAATETAQAAVANEDQQALSDDAQAAAIAASVAAAQSASIAEAQAQATAQAAVQAAQDAAAADAVRAATEAQQARLATEAEVAQSQVETEAAQQSVTAEEATQVAIAAQVQAETQAERLASIAEGAATVPAPETEPAAAEAPPRPLTTTAPDTEAVAPASPEPPVDVASVAPQTQTQPQTQPQAPAPTTTAVKVNRLPTTQSSIVDRQTEPEPETPVEEAAGESVPEDAPPLMRYASDFANADGKPLMSIVLLDDGVDLGTGPIGLDALRSFPYPITFAVDAELPDASDRMSAYRAGGFEVVAVVDLPKGATATDAEVTLASALSTVPEAVAIMEGVDNAGQATRAAAEQVSEILLQTGHGFVTQNRGLNTPQKLAERAGVPSAVVFRDFDAQGQKEDVIRRFLDQAAFRARQEGAVIMLGRLREDTVSALLVWGLQDRAAQVAMAPVSAVLQDK